MIGAFGEVVTSEGFDLLPLFALRYGRGLMVPNIASLRPDACRSGDDGRAGAGVEGWGDEGVGRRYCEVNGEPPGPTPTPSIPEILMTAYVELIGLS